ncbi:hypothetical protein [Flexivirga caeni]|uniref:DUF4829 domain-containing protein n=1 Tax=Flexivirga caeni TaxID=2294115 RepID=A0A3M9M2W0_9MICO|nr:hypothetical protein [Flexivirga caeni]RNI19890.1 hypothetical protein EFY87_15825 [Flexivirga caeni]
MRRTQSAVGLGLAIVVMLGILGLWLWGKPRASVPLPTAQTSPSSVVMTFAKALNDRDFPTAKEMVVGDRVGVDAGWWDLHGPRIEDLEITRTGPVTAGSTCGSPPASAWKQCVEVDTLSTFRHVKGMTKGNKPDRERWSYFLVRTNSSERWRILDWGKA